MQRTKIHMATLAAFTAPVVALAGTANAATHYKWSRSTTGSAGHGYVYRTNGYLKNHWTIADTKADGHCAYVYLRALTLNTTPWGSTWVGGSKHRHEVCQHGHSITGTDQWSIDGSSSPATKKIRLEAQVCRDINNRSDNCSDWYASHIWNA